MGEDEKKAPAAPPTLVENLFAPEVFVTDVPTWSVGSGTVTLVLASHRYDNSAGPNELRRVVIGRVTMPVPVAQNLAVGLWQFLNERGFGVATSEEKSRPQ